MLSSRLVKIHIHLSFLQQIFCRISVPTLQLVSLLIAAKDAPGSNFLRCDFDADNGSDADDDDDDGELRLS